MDKATGQPYLADGHTVTAEAEFIAESPQGYVELEYTLDGKGLKGKELVVFEKLFDGDKQVAAHEDINELRTFFFYINLLFSLIFRYKLPPSAPIYSI